MQFFGKIIISCVVFPCCAVYAVNVVFIFEQMRGGEQVNWRTTPFSGHSSQLFGDILLFCLSLFLFNYFHYLSLVISKKDKIKVENFEYLCQNMGWNTFQESFIVQWRSITSSPPVQMVDICQFCRSNLRNKMNLTNRKHSLSSPVGAPRRSPCWRSPSWRCSHSGTCRGCRSTSSASSADCMWLARSLLCGWGTVGRSASCRPCSSFSLWCWSTNKSRSLVKSYKFNLFRRILSLKAEKSRSMGWRLRIRPLYFFCLSVSSCHNERDGRPWVQVRYLLAREETCLFLFQ